MLPFCAWHNRLNNVMNVYKQFSSSCCAVGVLLQQLSFALVCVYFLTDNQFALSSHVVVDVIGRLEAFAYTLNADCAI